MLPKRKSNVDLQMVIDIVWVDVGGYFHVVLF